jgi:hypothetical protein
MEYESHPAADLFPMMTDAELDALGEDMLQHGQREPIILYRGQILDGRNRYRACIVKGIEPKFMEGRPADPYAFVATANLHRRHLSDEQRGMIAARLATMKQGNNQHSPNGETSQAKAAELLKVSKRRVERSHKVMEKGVPDLVDAVERRDVKVSAAAEFAKVTPPLDQQRLIAEHGSVAAAVKATVKTKADRADKKEPRKVPDPKPAADRAEARTGPDDVGTHRQRLDQLYAMLGAFTALKKLGDADQVAEAVLRLDVGNPVPRLLRVSAFTTKVVTTINSKLKSPNAAGGAA